MTTPAYVAAVLAKADAGGVHAAVALHKYLEEQRIRKGDRVMLLALASGIEIGIAIFTVDSQVDRYGHTH